MNTSNNNNLRFLDIVSLGSAGLGVYNTILNQKQITNDEVAEKVTNIVKEENKRAIERIEADINKILKILKGSEKMNRESLENKIENKLIEEIDKMINKKDLNPHEIKCLMYLWKELEEEEEE